MCDLKDFADLKLDSFHRRTLDRELGMWHEQYLPKILDKSDPQASKTLLAGKTVLDVGAGNGETARLFLNHGAEHVVCIEPYTDFLRANYGSDPRVTIVPRAVDHIKIDVEGAERDMRMEVHFPYRWETILHGPHIRIIRLTEYWGNPVQRFVRKGTIKLLGKLRII